MNENTLVAYFSRKGINFRVGSVEKGSAEILADMIADLLGASEYEICTAEGYPDDLEECNRKAKQEHEENARPELRNALPDMSGFSNLVLVYPNWWGDMPMAVYTFLDGIRTEGLDIYPVCTHEDNGLAMTERILSQTYPKARIMKGVAIRGTLVQCDRNSTKDIVTKYLSDRGFIKK